MSYVLPVREDSKANNDASSQIRSTSAVSGQMEGEMCVANQQEQQQGFYSYSVTRASSITPLSSMVNNRLHEQELLQHGSSVLGNGGANASDLFHSPALVNLSVPNSDCSIGENSNYVYSNTPCSINNGMQSSCEASLPNSSQYQQQQQFDYHSFSTAGNDSIDNSNVMQHYPSQQQHQNSNQSQQAFQLHLINQPQQQQFHSEALPTSATDQNHQQMTFAYHDISLLSDHLQRQDNNNNQPQHRLSHLEQPNNNNTHQYMQIQQSPQQPSMNFIQIPQQQQQQQQHFNYQQAICAKDDEYSKLPLISNHQQQQQQPMQSVFPTSHVQNASEAHQQQACSTPNPLSSTSKPFPCPDCDKTFRLQSQQATHHDVVHKKIRPFHCDVCDQDFSCRGNFVKHHETKSHIARKVAIENGYDLNADPSTLPPELKVKRRKKKSPTLSATSSLTPTQNYQNTLFFDSQTASCLHSLSPASSQCSQTRNMPNRLLADVDECDRISAELEICRSMLSDTKKLIKREQSEKVRLEQDRPLMLQKMQSLSQRAQYREALMQAIKAQLSCTANSQADSMFESFEQDSALGSCNSKSDALYIHGKKLANYNKRIDEYNDVTLETYSNDDEELKTFLESDSDIAACSSTKCSLTTNNSHEFNTLDYDEQTCLKQQRIEQPHEQQQQHAFNPQFKNSNTSASPLSASSVSNNTATPNETTNMGFHNVCNANDYLLNSSFESELVQLQMQ